MNFHFFDRPRAERRSYDYTAWHVEFIHREIQRMRRMYPDGVFPMPSEGPLGHWNCPSTTVSHVAAPPREGLSFLEGRFNIKLPRDFCDFYRLHNEAFILGRNPLLIMSPEQIAAVSDDLREAHEVEKDLPRHVMRFGWLGTDSYFLLRYCVEANDWEVMLSSYSHATDAELQDRLLGQLVATGALLIGCVA